jgi:hypothetical protein
MNKFLAAIAAGVCLSFGAAHAADQALSAQQQKMAACNQQASGKRGAERRNFLQECLGANHSAIAHTHPRQGKMKACNAEARTKALKGEERQAFMKMCLGK